MNKTMKGIITHDCCALHCRDWRETENGKLPASNHAPSCENYKTKKFIHVITDDGCYVDYLENLELIKQVTDDPVTFEEIEMTQDQFDRLDEFQGF